MPHQDTIDQFAKRVDLNKHVGDDVVLAINIKENGVAVPSAEITPETGLKTSQGEDVTVSWTTTEPVAGQVLMRLLPADTTALGEGRFVFWCTIIRNGIALTYVNGELELKPKWSLQ